jgi:putative membrane protein
MTFKFSEPERKKVVSAIRQSEKKTSGEIVAVVARQSDEYHHVPLHVAAGIALATPLIVKLIERFFPWSTFPLGWLFALQLLIFIVVAIVLSLPPLRYWVTPKSLMRKYASRHAAWQFLAVGAHGTGGRTGVLIFASLLERHAEIVADTAITAKVPQARWQAIIDDMLPLMRENRVADAFAQAIEACGQELATHFPPGSHNPNELPDHFIVLD